MKKPDNQKSWFAVNRVSKEEEKKTGYAAEVEIYSEIGFWGVTASEFAASIKGIKGRILVRISSIGGSVQDGIAIYNVLRSRSGGVDTVVDSWAASIASVIMLAGEKRTIGTGGFVMVHRAGMPAWGNADEIRRQADELEKLETGIRSIYTDRLGVDDETITQWFDGENHWFNADEALVHGFATESSESVKAVARATAEDIRSKFPDAPPAALALGVINNEPQKKEPMKDLLKALGLSEDDNEATAIAAVDKLAKRIENANTKTEQLEKQLVESNTKIQAANKAAAEVEVESAIKSGKIDPENKASWLAIAEADLETAKGLIAGIKVKVAGGTTSPPVPVTPPPANAKPTDGLTGLAKAIAARKAKSGKA